MQPMQMTVEELEWWVNYAKTLPTYSDAQYIENALRERLLGLDSSQDKELLNSIRTYFYVNFYEKAYSEVKAKIDDRLIKSYNLPKINVIDEQIAEGVIEIQEHFNSSRDYYSIFLILYDKCHWPQVLTDFCSKFSRLSFPGPLRYSIVYDYLKPSGSSLYQAIKGGKKIEWPITYDEWLTYQTDDKAFIHRREVASKFLDILKEKEKCTMDVLS